jgi:hypothetical protein
MAQFQYQILVGKDESNVRSGVVWFLNGIQDLGPHLPQILNELGNQGWEVAGIGDLGFGGRAEIVLKRSAG